MKENVPLIADRWSPCVGGSLYERCPFIGGILLSQVSSVGGVSLKETVGVLFLTGFLYGS